MPLKMKFTKDDGTSGEFWNVDSVHLDFGRNEMEARVNLYHSSGAFSDGKRPMPEQRIIVMDIPENIASLPQLCAHVCKAAKDVHCSGDDMREEPFFSEAKIV